MLLKGGLKLLKIHIFYQNTYRSTTNFYSIFLLKCFLAILNDFLIT
jgi:hypothetical protein